MLVSYSVRQVIESNPAMIGSVPRAPLTTSPQPEKPIEFSPTEYGKLKLSQDNLLVDTYAVVKAFKAQGKSKLSFPQVIIKSWSLFRLNFQFKLNFQGFSSNQAEVMTYAFTQLLNDALKEQRKLCVEKAGLVSKFGTSFCYDGRHCFHYTH